MKKILLAITFFVFIDSLKSQTKENFLEAVRSNHTSFGKLKISLDKFNDNNTNWEQPQTFFNNKSFFTVYYLRNSNAQGPAYSLPLRIFHTGDTIVYLSAVIEGKWDNDKGHRPCDTLYRYIDSNYLDITLTKYNKANKVNFVWQDLFEDKIDRFYIVPSMGAERYKTIWETKYTMMIQNKDHLKIQEECKSFNTARMVYGALALHILQNEGEKLDGEEIRLLENIWNSRIKVHYSYGCLGSYQTAAEILKEYMDDEKKLNPEFLKNNLTRDN